MAIRLFTLALFSFAFYLFCIQFQRTYTMIDFGNFHFFPLEEKNSKHGSPVFRHRINFANRLKKHLCISIRVYIVFATARSLHQLFFFFFFFQVNQLLYCSFFFYFLGFHIVSYANRRTIE